MGKGPDAKGILLPEHMAQALAHLKQAIAEEEAILAKQKESPKSTAEQEDAAPAPAISLRTRAWPLVLMIERSQQAQVPVTWGV